MMHVAFREITEQLQLQIKALVVTLINGDNFRLIPANCMVSQTCVLQ